jgi:hypothetical protein
MHRECIGYAIDLQVVYYQLSDLSARCKMVGRRVGLASIKEFDKWGVYPEKIVKLSLSQTG